MRRYAILLFTAALHATFLSILIFRPVTSQETEYLTYLPVLQNQVDASWRWHEPEEINLIPTPFKKPVSIIDHNGRLHLFWDTLTEPRLIYHTVLSSDGWAEVQPIAQTYGTSYLLYPPGISEDGIIHFVWRNWLGPSLENPYRLMYARFDGFHWSAEEEIVRTQYEMQAMVQTGDPGEIHVTYVGTAFFSSIYHTKRTDHGWTSISSLHPSHSVSLVWPDRYGGIHLYESYNYTNDLHYSYWLGGDFVIENSVFHGNLLGHESQLDGQKNLHIFWSGQVPVVGSQIQGLYYQCLSNNLVASPEQVLSGETEITGLAIKASDNKSRIALAWKEAATGNVQLMIRNQCDLQKTKSIPLPEGKNWEPVSLALSAEPKRACILVKQAYTTNYSGLCADIID